MNRRRAAIALSMMLLVAGAAHAQSGRSVMRGWVAFDGVAYVDKQPRAKVELVKRVNGDENIYAAETDDHGHFQINVAALGECTLRISAPDFTTYEIAVYIPSDFVGNLAVLLKRDDDRRKSK